MKEPPFCSWLPSLLPSLLPSPLSPPRPSKRAFTIADLYKIKNVTDPVYSPDGKRVAFVVTEFFLEEGKTNSDIFVMNADGTGLRRMTRDDAADSSPRWSPDGRSLLFVSTREDGAQAWTMPIEGGEAAKLTSFAMEVSSPRWLPDGKKILFYTEVFPECGGDDACNKALADDIEKGPVHAHLADDLLYRHWTFWKDGKRFHTILFDTEAKTYVDLTPRNMDAPSFLSGGANAGLDLSPDGSEICVAANADPNEWETTNKDLWLVSTVGRAPGASAGSSDGSGSSSGGSPAGDMKNITDENEAYDGNPQYSPDGRYIAYLMQKIPAFEADLFRLALYDRRTGEKKILTEDFDNWVGNFEWAPDSKSIYFTSDTQGANPLYKIDLASRKITRLVDLRTIDSFDISPDGRSVVVSRRSVGEPREIWTCATNGKSAKRITTFNKAVEDEVDIRPAEEMWIDSPTGKKIHTFVVKPHGFDPAKKYPLILNVHGGPQQQWMDAFRGDWQVYPGCGYVVAFPNPHGSTGYGQEFTHAISRDWGGKVYEDCHGRRRFPGIASLDRQGPDGRDGVVVRRVHDDVVRGSHGSLQVSRVDDGLVQPHVDVGRDRGALVSAVRPRRGAVGVRRLREMVAAVRRRQVQDADPRHHGGEGLPHTLYREPAVLHRAPQEGRAGAAHRIRERRPLAERGEVDAALLRGAPRLVPHLSGRRAFAVRCEGHGEKPGIRDEGVKAGRAERVSRALRGSDRGSPAAVMVRAARWRPRAPAPRVSAAVGGWPTGPAR